MAMIPQIRLKFEPRDIWVGIYWNLTKSIESSYKRLDVYVCILPLLPIKLTWEWGWKNPTYKEPPLGWTWKVGERK